MRNKKLIFVGLVLLIFGLLFYGCENGGSGEPPQGVQDAVEAVFAPIATYMDMDVETLPNPYTGITGISFYFDETSSTVTITFSGYTDNITGYSVNGTITLSRTVSSDETTMTITATGTVTLTGGSVSELDFDISMSGAYDPVEDDFAGEPTPSGTITADGTSYDFADFDLFGVDEGGEITATDPHFIIAGMSGTIVYSSDGSAWGYPNVVESDGTGVSVDLYGIASDSSGNCVAVGKSGTILYSDNGLNWTQVATTPKDLNGVVWGNGTWVAVADQQTILYSSDRQNWNSATISGTPDQLYDVSADSSGKFVAIGTGTNNCAYSDGGATWTISQILTGSQTYYNIAYNGSGRWVAVGFGGIIAYSDNAGQTWKGAVSGTTADLTGIEYGNGKFIAVGTINGSPPVPVMIYSSDGSSWNPITLPSEFTSVERPLRDIATDGSGRWSAVGSGGDHLLSTDNGATWQVIALDKYGSYAIAYRP